MKVISEKIVKEGGLIFLVKTIQEKTLVSIDEVNEKILQVQDEVTKLKQIKTQIEAL